MPYIKKSEDFHQFVSKMYSVPSVRIFCGSPIAVTVSSDMFILIYSIYIKCDQLRMEIGHILEYTVPTNFEKRIPTKSTMRNSPKIFPSL